MSAISRRERGFTIIEIMIAMTVLVIGMAGIVKLTVASMRASALSRHATEATVLAEDKMEFLRTVPVAALVSGTDQVDARGKVVADAPYTREWAVAVAPAFATLTVSVTVTWYEEGGTDPLQVLFRTERAN